jgi:multicomponent Na+:H+ antiporter subunit F
MSLIHTFILITIGMLVLAILFALIQMVRGKTLWDRILMLNLISAKVVLIIALYAVFVDNMMFLDIAISYGIIGFLTMTLLSKFIMTGGRHK